MSYARWGVDGSSVYVYDDVDHGLICCCTPMFKAKNNQEMIEHLKQHRKQGWSVPWYVFDSLSAQD